MINLLIVCVIVNSFVCWFVRLFVFGCGKCWVFQCSYLRLARLFSRACVLVGARARLCVFVCLYVCEFVRWRSFM